MTFNIYVPSYKRSNKIMTNNLLEYCTYIVRKSEEEAYVNAGVKVLAVEDKLITGLPAVYNYIIEQTPEDVVCICDDDIKNFSYRLETLEKITDPVIITTEIERLAQILCDINKGYLVSPLDANPKYYDRAFKFCGQNGQMRIINKSVMKARWDASIGKFYDNDVQLRELLINRIILIPSYFCVVADIDTNSGGNCDSNSRRLFDSANAELKIRWGKYIDIKNDIHHIRVKR